MIQSTTFNDASRRLGPWMITVYLPQELGGGWRWHWTDISTGNRFLGNGCSIICTKASCFNFCPPGNKKLCGANDIYDIRYPWTAKATCLNKNCYMIHRKIMKKHLQSCWVKRKTTHQSLKNFEWHRPKVEVFSRWWRWSFASAHKSWHLLQWLTVRHWAPVSKVFSCRAAREVWTKTANHSKWKGVVLSLGPELDTVLSCLI